jgi:hypothetical protein
VNMLGQKVAAIYQDKLMQGTHQFTWNCEKVSQGIYLLHIQNGKEVITQRLSVMK